ncbi:MAG TPA: haloacid dehalogenase-like hydrolase [Clostridia bacterium]|nr:haloacid dehalogenase-like hydrolase [Clostridia bacterium]
MKMNVYDFDNTIYDGESGLDIFFYFLKRNPSLLKHIFTVGIGFIKYKLHMVTLEMVTEKYLDVIESSIRSLDNFEEDINKFWDKNIKKIKPFFKEHYKEGDLILTASPEATIKEVCRRLNVENYIGTKVDIQSGKIHFICYRENKVTAFREKYPHAEIDCFYTDSMNDKPIIDISKHAYLVKKHKLIKLK